MGYLPRIASANIPEFEVKMRQEFPDYRIWEIDKNEASYIYPLAYAVNYKEPEQLKVLRGLNYASVKERKSAIQDALYWEESRTTILHPAVHDSTGKRVVLLFTPIYDENLSSIQNLSSNKSHKKPLGFIFSVIYVDDLFTNFNHDLKNTQFDLEVFEGNLKKNTLIYDGDQVTHSLLGNLDLQLLNKTQISFGGRPWLIFIYQKSLQKFEELLVSSYAGMILFGILLSLIFAYIGVRIRRHYKMLEQQAWQADNFESFFENHPFPVYLLDTQRRFVAVNKKAEIEFGMTANQLAGISLENFLSVENAQMSRSYFQQALQGKAISYHNWLTQPDGTVNDLSIVLVPITNGNKITSVLGIAKNITEKKKADQDLYRSRQTLQLVLDNIPQFILWKDTQGFYQGGNKSLLKFIGLDNIQQLKGKTDFEMPWKEYAQIFITDADIAIRTGQFLYKHQEIQLKTNAGYQWLEISTLPVRGLEGGIDSILYVIDDITDRKETEAELFKRANYDSLTKLPNRAYFYHKLETTLLEHARVSRDMALMYFDIDKFKNINDSYGHDVGDKVIQEFAYRVSIALRASDFLARLGGDEFILFIQDVKNIATVEIIAEKIIEIMRNPFLIGDLKLNVSTSIGISMFKAGQNIDEWIKKSDQALYEAKNSGRNQYKFSKL
ncbi:diguanylate cyclase [Acinetobacter sp. FDAARGOS_724]|nr:diguanylate cyclase [Acinetobacter sp. FDAARGOS_724]QKW82282.1 diguanylate cyclase [Acinetobacter sp. FDAARGOS_724]